MSVKKKDFVAIGNAMREATREAVNEADERTQLIVRQTIGKIVANMSDYFAAENEQFDKDRFAESCGVKLK